MTPLEEREAALAKLAKSYSDAKDLLAVHDSAILAEVCELAKQFRCGDGPDIAIFVLAQVKKTIEPIIKAQSAITEYESKQRTVKEMRNRITQPSTRTQ